MTWNPLGYGNVVGQGRPIVPSISGNSAETAQAIGLLASTAGSTQIAGSQDCLAFAGAPRLALRGSSASRLPNPRQALASSNEMGGTVASASGLPNLDGRLSYYASGASEAYAVGGSEGGSGSSLSFGGASYATTGASSSYGGDVDNMVGSYASNLESMTGQIESLMAKGDLSEKESRQLQWLMMKRSELSMLISQIMSAAHDARKHIIGNIRA